MLFFLLVNLVSGLLYPTQIHLSWTENKNEIRVTWLSRMDCIGKVSFRSILCENSSSWQSSESNSTRIDTGLVGYRYGYMHTSVLSGLSSSCFYEYQVSNGGLWSDIFVFNGKTPSSPIESYQILILGDLGTYDDGQKTFDMIMDMIENQEVLGLAHLGDLGYDLEDQEGLIGDKFLNMIQPFAANYPYMTIPGNHEKFNNFTHYKMRFNMPVNEANQGSGYFYSYDLGYIHYVFISTTHYLYDKWKDQAEIQTNWLKNDLYQANLNRGEVPWIVMMHHHALYCVKKLNDTDVNQDCVLESGVMRKHLEEIYFTNKVDLVMQAHVHHYERSGSIYMNLTVIPEQEGNNFVINAKAPIYIVTGNAGNKRGKNDPVPLNHCLWTKVTSDEFGFGKLEVVNKTRLYWEQYSSETNSLVDYFYLDKF